jgi:hypothetical protein
MGWVRGHPSALESNERCIFGFIRAAFGPLALVTGGACRSSRYRGARAMDR